MLPMTGRFSRKEILLTIRSAAKATLLHLRSSLTMTPLGSPTWSMGALETSLTLDMQLALFLLALNLTRARDSLQLQLSQLVRNVLRGKRIGPPLSQLVPDRGHWQYQQKMMKENLESLVLWMKRSTKGSSDNG